MSTELTSLPDVQEAVPFEEQVYGLRKQLITVSMRVLRTYQSRYMDLFSLAEELVQEAMMKAIRAKDTFNHGSRLSTWMISITIRHAIDFTRKKTIATTSLDEWLEANPDGVIDWQDEGDVEASLITRVEDEQLRQALSRLPWIYRSIIVLRYFQGFTMQETGDRLSLPLGTVKSRSYQAFSLLRTELISIDQGGPMRNSKAHSAPPMTEIFEEPDHLEFDIDSEGLDVWDVDHTDLE